MTKRITKKVLAFVVMCSLVLLAGCGNTESTSDNKAKQTSAAVEENTLKSAFSDDFYVGASVVENDLFDKEELKFVTEHFNSITMENAMKPENILDVKSSKSSGDGMPVIRTSNLDNILKYAKAADLHVRFHTLVWYSQTPKAFFCKDYDESNDFVSKKIMTARMESYIKQVMGFIKENYKGVVYAVDVVNEAVSDSGGPRTDSMWYEVYGDDSYIEDAFTFARKYADEDTKLYYNDYNSYQEGKIDDIISLLERLQKKKLVDGMGMQSHWDMDYPSAMMLENALTRYGKLGLDVQLTEIDMHNTDDSKEGLAAQADRYKEFFEAIVKAKREKRCNITSVTFWGLYDEKSWLSDFKGETSYPLLFTADKVKKPCYDSILQTANK